MNKIIITLAREAAARPNDTTWRLRSEFAVIALQIGAVLLTIWVGFVVLLLWIGFLIAYSFRLGSALAGRLRMIAVVDLGLHTAAHPQAGVQPRTTREGGNQADRRSPRP